MCLCVSICLAVFRQRRDISSMKTFEDMSLRLIMLLRVKDMLCQMLQHVTTCCDMSQDTSTHTMEACLYVYIWHLLGLYDICTVMVLKENNPLSVMIYYYIVLIGAFSSIY